MTLALIRLGDCLQAHGGGLPKEEQREGLLVVDNFGYFSHGAGQCLVQPGCLRAVNRGLETARNPSVAGVTTSA